MSRQSCFLTANLTERELVITGFIHEERGDSPILHVFLQHGGWFGYSHSDQKGLLTGTRKGRRITRGGARCGAFGARRILAAENSGLLQWSTSQCYWATHLVGGGK